MTWPVPCAACGGTLPALSRADAIYCSPACRQRAWRRRCKLARPPRQQPSRRAGEPSRRAAGYPSRPPAPEPSRFAGEDPSRYAGEDPCGWDAIPRVGWHPSRVVALYVSRRGPYPALLGARACWPRERDARTWDGPGAAVAHPPCAPWSRARALSAGRDRECGPRAVEQVRTWGGVLEHPAESLLWPACGLPLPGQPPDPWGGISVEVYQARWGHPARKPTWLYLVGASLLPVPPGSDDGGRVLDLPTSARIHTPPAFAGWLAAIAATVAPRQVVAVAEDVAGAVAQAPPEPAQRAIRAGPWRSERLARAWRLAARAPRAPEERDPEQVAAYQELRELWQTHPDTCRAAGMSTLRGMSTASIGTLRDLIAQIEPNIPTVTRVSGSLPCFDAVETITGEAGWQARLPLAEDR